MAEYNRSGIDYCRICGKRLQLGDVVETVKPKYGPKFYVHTDCLKKEGAKSNERE